MLADGGTRCASVTGAFVALMGVDRWLRRKGIIEGSIVEEFQAAVSVGISGGEKLLDLCYQEDSKASVDMNVVMTERGDFTEIQVSGEGTSFSRDDFNGLLDLAAKGIEGLIKFQKEVLEI